ncbi:MAG TPA: dienelactone hydrolase family protein [Thermoanaerobaculia bacterium]|nr:dienelactone hydrolase family protein [Thermoanaerobaculia bacterium]HQR68598.1 dienelactone hydrolase family protein [Thermoanaerobaculia bacterium]
MKVLVTFSAALAISGWLSGPALSQTDPHAGHAMEKPSPAAAPAPRNEALPPDAEQAKAALAKSPRHGEWVDVPFEGSGKLLTWVVYPERKEKAPVVLVIHEIYGLTDWIRGVADQLAKEGFIALAPDLLSGLGPGGGGTEALKDDVGKAIRTLTPEMVAARLNAVRDYALKLPAAGSKTGSVGFCWGGSSSFAYAVAQPKLDAAVVYYGTSPADAAAYAKIAAPVLGLYGGDDARVNATIPAAEAEMKKLGKKYTPMIFDGAGHGFLRQQTGRDGANMKASERAWAATLAFLRENLK